MKRRAREVLALRALQRRVWGDNYYDRHLDARAKRKRRFAGVGAIALGLQMLIGAFGLLAFASSASAHESSIDISCTAVTFDYSIFPDVSVLAHESITIDGMQGPVKDFSFTGPDGHDTITITLGPGPHTIVASTSWVFSGAPQGSGELTKQLDDCGGVCVPPTTIYGSTTTMKHYGSTTTTTPPQCESTTTTVPASTTTVATETSTTTVPATTTVPETTSTTTVPETTSTTTVPETTSTTTVPETTSTTTSTVPETTSTTTVPETTSTTVSGGSSTTLLLPTTTTTFTNGSTTTVPGETTTVPVTTQGSTSPPGGPTTGPGGSTSPSPGGPLPFTGSSTRPLAFALAMVGLGFVASGLARRQRTKAMPQS